MHVRSAMEILRATKQEKSVLEFDRMPTRRILIVEDEEANIDVVRNILEIMLDQDDLLVARDGHEGIKLAYEHDPEIILMDLSLPKLDGWEVARSLKVTLASRRFRFWLLLPNSPGTRAPYSKTWTAPEPGPRSSKPSVKQTVSDSPKWNSKTQCEENAPV